MPVVIDGTNGVSSPDYEVDGVTGKVYPVVSDIAKTASGTSVDFTGIPSWVKRITVIFRAVSYAAAGVGRIRLGTSSGLVATGYVSNNLVTSSTGTSSAAFTDGIILANTSAAAATFTGQAVITQIDTNIWVGTGNFYRTTDDTASFSNGSIALSGTLDRLSLVATTSTFDAGTINIFYE